MFRLRLDRMATAIAAGALVAGSLSAAAPAASAPTCSTVAPPIEVAKVSGELEALAVDDDGRLFLTDLLNQYVWRIDHPGATPVVLAKGFSSLGGIVVRPDGKLLVGSGNDPLVGLSGYLLPSAKIFLVDPDTGAKSVFAVVRSADGLAQGPDGSVYASNLFGTSIARIRPGGQVDLDWARMAAPNGLAVDRTNTYLYVARSVVDGVVTRVPIANPAAATDFAPSTGLDKLSVPDGLTLDSAGNPVVAEHLGQIWSVDPAGGLCALTKGLYLSSNVGYGRGDAGFSRGRLFRVGFDGVVYELPSGFDPGA
jgi:gluconolactonase